MNRIRTALVLISLGVAAPSRTHAEAPSAAAISAYSAECKRTGEAMDLIARFGSDYSGLNLAGVDFRGAHTAYLETNLQGADFTGTNLQGAEFGASLLDAADFTGADLRKAQFVTASLREAKFQNANLTGAHFQECDLAGAQLQGLTLSNATWAGHEFQGANLSGADLRGMSLRGANFKHATLRSADLSGCNLEEADFTRADLAGANLRNVYVVHAVFDDVRGLPSAELQRLNRQTGRWQFELNRDITAFMDSPAFALCLLVVVPLLTLAWHKLNRTREPAAGAAQGRWFRFSVARLLTVLLAIALVLGVARWTWTGVYSLVMVSALTMMGTEICYGRVGRGWPASILAASLIYSALNFALYYAIFQSSIYISIFSPRFAGTVVLLGPFLTMVAGVASAFFQPNAGKEFPWTGLAGLIIWMIGVAWANLYIIAEAAASV